MPPAHLCKQPAAEHGALSCGQGALGLARVHLPGVLEAWCPVHCGPSHERGDKEIGQDLQAGAALREVFKSSPTHQAAPEAHLQVKCPFRGICGAVGREL